MPSKISRLLALSDAEFKRRRTQPQPKLKTFKPKSIDVRKFGPRWDRERGAAVRMMASVLRLDSEALLERVSVDAETANTYSEAARWLAAEAELLRTTADRQEQAAARIKSTVCRYRAAQQQQAQQRPAEQPAGSEAAAP